MLCMSAVLVISIGKKNTSPSSSCFLGVEWFAFQLHVLCLASALILTPTQESSLLLHEHDPVLPFSKVYRMFRAFVLGIYHSAGALFSLRRSLRFWPHVKDNMNIRQLMYLKLMFSCLVKLCLGHTCTSQDIFPIGQMIS